MFRKLAVAIGFASLCLSAAEQDAKTVIANARGSSAPGTTLSTCAASVACDWSRIAPAICSDQSNRVAISL